MWTVFYHEVARDFVSWMSHPIRSTLVNAINQMDSYVLCLENAL